MFVFLSLECAKGSFGHLGSLRANAGRGIETNVTQGGVD